MCRLLGLTAGREPISASFWLLDAPDSLAVVHVRPDLTVESAVVLPDPPAHLVPLPAGPNIDT
ncbi:MAG TPA: hypothetical protein VH642_14425 [Streptosporangiaceae bacterium]